MPFEQQATAVPKKVLWAGYVISALPLLALVPSAIMKFARPQPVIEGFQHLGWPESLSVALGVIEVTCTVLYIIPRTAVLGAILLTGYLGGAIATHFRISEQFAIPVVLGIFVWLGLYLRDPRIRQLIPLRSNLYKE
jgi:hypothetical protein